VVVTNLNPGGPAAELGVRISDIILDVSGKPVNTPSELRQGVSDARSAGKHAVLMRIKSGNSMHFVELPVASG
jgi:serine protease Do